MITRRAFINLCFGTGLLLIGCGKKQAPTPTATEISEFHAAIQDGDAEIVRRLLQAKPYLVNVKNQDGKTPLAIANEKGNQELADVLRKNGGHE